MQARRVFPLGASLASVLITAWLGGCRLNDGPAAEGGNQLAVAAAVVNTSFYDVSGRIEIRVKTCDPTAAATTNCAYCIIDDGYAMVGGGANILGEASAGAMLQASFPDPVSPYSANAGGCTGPAGFVPPRVLVDDRNKWTVRASGASHQLQAYVIGMRLKGTDGNWFKPTVSNPRDNVGILAASATSLQVEATEQTLGQQDEILIGGGAYIYKKDGNQDQAAATNAYLVGSYPVDGANGRAWRAIARSQANPPPEQIMKAYALFISQCPPGFGTCFDYPQIRSLTAAATTGYGTASQYHPGFGINTSVGGYATTTGTARYLADLIPLSGSNMGFTVRSKSFATGNNAASGQTLGYGMNLGIPAFDIYSAVYNHSNKCLGVSNARMDATAPFTQKTCTYGNEPANLRFAMVQRPGGYVALKFEHSGMCMDIGGASVDNGAAAIQYPCSYADNQLVQLLSYGVGRHYFKFKHSGKCLDVSGAGTGDGTAFIQYACANQDNQTFRFDD